MNIGSTNFLRDNLEANPTLSGISQGLQRQKMRLGNRASRARLPYIGPEEEEKLKQAQLGNQKSQIDLQYEQPTMEALLQSKRLGNDMQTESILRQRILNKFLPQLQQSIIDRNGRFGTGFGGRLGGVRGQMQDKLLQNIQAEHPDWDEKKVREAANSYIDGAPALPSGEVLPKPAGLIKTTLDQLVLSSNTAGGVNQQRFAKSLDTAIQNVKPLANRAFKYAGIVGQAGLQAAKAAAQNGKVDPDYAAYKEFTEQALPALASELLRTGGANSTDQQKLMAITQADPITWSGNPELARQQFEYLINLYQDISKTLAESPSEIRTALKNPKNENTDNSGNKVFNVEEDENGQLVVR